MTNKEQARVRRAKRTRMNIQELNKVRLCVHRTPRHIYAQVISGDGAAILVAASTVEKAVQADLKYTGNVSAAEQVGKIIAERAIKAGISAVAFDRSGYLYHGRVKALAEGARKGGLKF